MTHHWKGIFVKIPPKMELFLSVKSYSRGDQNTQTISYEVGLIGLTQKSGWEDRLSSEFRNELAFVSKRSFHRFKTNFKTLLKRSETNYQTIFQNVFETNRKRNFVWLQTFSKRKWNECQTNFKRVWFSCQARFKFVWSQVVWNAFETKMIWRRSLTWFETIYYF